ncbi:MAG: four helix bundle suffix domain-containing protein [Planctomycetota bacterium]|nr:four helix bundle suffix domain-containing protein [Planctomycetota bacterium]
MTRQPFPTPPGRGPGGKHRTDLTDPTDRSDHTGQQPDHTGQQPDHAGQQPDHAGQQPDRTGQQPDHAGQPNHTGQQPDHTGQPSHTGQPRQAGQSRPASGPGRTGEPGASGPPAPPGQTGPPSATGRGPRLRPSGGYRQLRSFQVATLIYDSTVDFCARFINQRSRTVDQMVQAARSGRQNIAEGSRASATSSQTELRLVNVARASLDELLLDYEDFLRQHHLPLWGKDSPEARKVRELRGGGGTAERTDPSEIFGPYGPWLNHRDPAIVANTVICLIHQANYLLDQQIGALERDFIQEGGYSERLAAARIAQRHSEQAAPSAQLPTCPLCGKLMALRTARQGPRAGSQFWGCTTYPACKGTRPLDGGDGR